MSDPLSQTPFAPACQLCLVHVTAPSSSCSFLLSYNVSVLIRLHAELPTRAFISIFYIFLFAIFSVYYIFTSQQHVTTTFAFQQPLYPAHLDAME